MAAVCDLDRCNLIINGAGGGLEPGVVHVGLVSGSYSATLL
jgi:hypothetical protein